MKKDLVWGGLMAAVGVGCFAWAAKDTFFVPPTEPSPTPRIHSEEKPTIAPTPTIALSDVLQSAKSAITNGQYEYSLSLLEKQDENAEVLDLTIEAYVGQGLYAKAEESIQKLLLVENTEENIIGYIRILLLQGKKDDAKSLLPKISASDEKTFYQLIIAVVEEENEEAEALSLSLSESADYASVSNAFTGVYKTYASFQDGSPHYLKTMLANVLKTLQFHRLTVEYIKPTLQEYPQYRDAWIVIGNSYLALKEFEVAERMLEKAVSLDPTHPVSPYLLGITLYELGQNEDAIAQIQTAIRNGYSPREKAERHIGDMYFADKNYESALEHYQYILTEGENPTLKDYTRSVYITLQEIDSLSLGNVFAQNAAEKMPENPAALALQGWVLIEEGNITEAQTLLKDLQLQYPMAQEPLLYLAKSYEREENYETAFDTYKACYEIAPQNIVGLECAQKYEELRITLQNEE